MIRTVRGKGSNSLPTWASALGCFREVRGRMIYKWQNFPSFSLESNRAIGGEMSPPEIIFRGSKIL